MAHSPNRRISRAVLRSAEGRGIPTFGDQFDPIGGINSLSRINDMRNFSMGGESVFLDRRYDEDMQRAIQTALEKGDDPQVCAQSFLRCVVGVLCVGLFA